MDPVTTAIFIMAWTATIDVIPVAKIVPYVSFAFVAITIPLHINIENKITIRIHPIKPNSSPIIENIKSLWGSGI